jgi:hypothetical protein
VDPGDSDDEAPMNCEVQSPFTSDESVYKKYWHLFAHAQDKYFQNAVGKYFLDSYFQLCTWVLKRDLQVYLSTNPNGKYQPGFAHVGWNLPKRTLQDRSLLSLSSATHTQSGATG